MKKNIFISTILLFVWVSACAQMPNIKKSRFVFSAVKGTVSKPDSVVFPAIVTRLTNSDTVNFKILSGRKNELIITFTPAVSFVGISNASLQGRDATGKLMIDIKLSGLSTNGLEGENEPTLTTVVAALGYKIDIGWTTLANNSQPALQGEEIKAALFHKAGEGNVDIVPVARYSPDFELPFGYYTNAAAVPVKKQVGVLSKTELYPEHQCLFPAIAKGAHSFDPGNDNFGFYATGPTHSAFSEDVWNMLFYPANAVHATRIYPLKDEKWEISTEQLFALF